MTMVLTKIFERGLRGHHLLFEPLLLGRALENIDDEDVDVITARQVSALADFLEEEGDFHEQRRIIQSAPDDAQEVFVRLYFDYLFDYLERSKPEWH